MNKKRIVQKLYRHFAVCMFLFFISSIVYAEPKAYECLVPESNSRYYSEEELKDMSLQVACYARNEIYARHGRIFQSKELREYFEEQPWYNGTIQPGDFSESVFNDYELANIQAIRNQEYAIATDGYPLDQTGYSFDPVYAYMLEKNSISIDSGLKYDETTRELKSAYFSVILPENWVDAWKYQSWNGQSFTFLCKAVYDLKNDYDGGLCTIMRMAQYEDPTNYPAADYLGEDGTFYYYALYPTDVRFDPNDQASMKSYRLMYEQVEELISSFEIINK